MDKAVTFAKYGAPLEITPLKLGELHPKQLLIKVFASSLNPVDYKRRDGMTRMIIKDEFPAMICFDVAGVVEKIGAEVQNFKVGQRICARSLKSGALADFCIVDEDVTAHIPDSVNFIEAAALPLAGLTALQSLRQGNLKKGDTIFISGGAGGVGTYAIQLAKHVFQASKVVTTCSAAKADFCQSLGADVCIDYTKVDPYSAAHGPFDMCFDTVGDARKMGGSLIKHGGHVVSVAAIPDPGAFDRIGRDTPFFLRAALAVASIRERWGASPGKYFYVLLQPNAKDLTELVGYMQQGKLKSMIDSVFEGIDKSTEAFNRLETGRAKGKVVVSIRKE